ncbi:MAG: alpha/beta fold hydrolase [Myxococcota bacterium]
MNRRWTLLFAVVLGSALFACTKKAPSGSDDKGGQTQGQTAQAEGTPWKWIRTQESVVHAVALLVHGRGQNPDELEDVVETLNSLGIDVLRVHLIGHPQGPETAAGLGAWLRQLEQAYKQVVQDASRTKGQLPVFGVGYSLGGALLVRLIQQAREEPILFSKLVLLAPAIAFTKELDKAMEVLQGVHQSADDKALQRLQRLWGYLFAELKETLNTDGEEGERYKEFFSAIPDTTSGAERFGRNLVDALKGEEAAWDSIRGDVPDELRPELDSIMDLEPETQSYEPFGEVLLQVDLALKTIADTMLHGKRRALQKQSTLIFIDPQELLVSEQNIQEKVIEPLDLSPRWRIESMVGAGHRGLIQITEIPDMTEQLEQFLGLFRPDEDEDV